MPRYIIKLEGKYFYWSTIVDNITEGPYTREELYENYRVMYGENGMRDLEERMKRVDAKGTSAISHKNVDETIAHNFAGPNHTIWSKEQIIKYYVHNEDPGPGEVPKLDEDDI